MHARTTWILLLLVVLGAALGWWLLEEERAPGQAFGQQLVPGLQAGEVGRVRIDNLERGVQVEFVRDELVGWRIVDPIDAPAEAVFVERLVADLAAAPALAAEQQDAGRLGLEPPRIVIELYRRGAPTERSARVEIGEPALNTTALYVRTADGRIWRTLRNLEASSDRYLHEWQSQRVFPEGPPPERAVEIERSGRAVLDGVERDLAFRAVATPTGWRATEPFVASLDPARAATFASLPARLRALRVARDDAAAAQDLGFGEPGPALRVEGVERTARLELRRSAAGWFAWRPDRTAVWELDALDVPPLLAPVEELVERQFLRVARADVLRVRIVKGASELELVRGEAGWRLGSAPQAPPADDARVHELLGELETSRCGDTLVREPFEPGEPACAIFVETAAGTYGGEIGAALELADGARGVAFRRPGEDPVLLAPARLRELCDLAPDGLRSRVLHELAEADLARIEIALGPESRTWLRDGRTGRWRLSSSADPDAAFELLVDRLRVLRALEWVSPGTGDAPAAGARVTLHPSAGGALAFSLGEADPESAEAAEYAGPRGRARVDAALLRDVRALFGR